MASAPPFGVMCMCFYINGVNFSLVNIQANGVLALLPTRTALGLGHSLFGAGALVAPLISTQFSQIPKWSFYYLVLLGVALADFTSLATVFWGKGSDRILQEMGIKSEESENSTSTSLSESPMKETSGDSAPLDNNTPAQDRATILPRKLYTPLLALFTLVCVGVEVSIGGTLLLFYEMVVDELQAGS